jgi:hypothetical protein
MCKGTSIPLLFHPLPTTAEAFISWGELFYYLLTVHILCYQPLHHKHFDPTIILKFLATHLVTNCPDIIAINVDFCYEIIHHVNLFFDQLLCLTYFFLYTAGIISCSRRTLFHGFMAFSLTVPYFYTFSECDTLLCAICHLGFLSKLNVE